MGAIHPAIQEELDMLRERFPGKNELTLDEYADYNGIGRRNAARHFRRANEGRHKIGHKQIGKMIIIPMCDFAYWLALQKIVDGSPLILPGDGDPKEVMKRRRGFSAAPQYEYRRLG